MQDVIVLTSRRPIQLDKLAAICAHGTSADPDPPGCMAASDPDPDPIDSRLRALSWRLGRDEASSTFNLMRSNLLALMAPGAGPPGRLRQLLVDLEPPQLGGVNGTAAVSRGMAHRGGGCWRRRSRPRSDLRPDLRSCVWFQWFLSLELSSLPSSSLPCSCPTSQSKASLGYVSSPAGASMNPDQREAVLRVLQMRDYALCLGMPGTGKTTTIVHIIKASASGRGGQGETGCTLRECAHASVDRVSCCRCHENRVRLASTCVIKLESAAAVFASHPPANSRHYAGSSASSGAPPSRMLDPRDELHQQRRRQHPA